jgi:hypothetical protein
MFSLVTIPTGCRLNLPSGLCDCRNDWYAALTPDAAANAATVKPIQTCHQMTLRTIGWS